MCIATYIEQDTLNSLISPRVACTTADQLQPSIQSMQLKKAYSLFFFSNSGENELLENIGPAAPLEFR